MNANIKIKLIYFAKKIGVLAVILIVLYFVSQIIIQLGGTSNNNINNINRTSQIEKKYNTPIYDTKVKLDDKIANKYVDTVRKYIDLCNNKNYEEAYLMLEKDYKSEHMESLEKFKEYVDKNFDKTKDFSYKNLYNQKNYSVYSIKLFDDIMKYGSNSYYDNNSISAEYTIHNIEGDTKIALNSFISKTFLSNNISEDNIQIKLLSKNIYYDRVSIKMEISNNSDKVFSFNTRDINYVKKQNSEYKEYENSMNFQAMTEITLLPNENKIINCNFENFIYVEKQIDFSVTIDKAYLYEFKDTKAALDNDITKAIKTYKDITISL